MSEDIFADAMLELLVLTMKLNGSIDENQEKLIREKAAAVRRLATTRARKESDDLGLTADQAPPWVLALQDKMRLAMPENELSDYLRDFSLRDPKWGPDDARWRLVEYRVRADLISSSMMHLAPQPHSREDYNIGIGVMDHPRRDKSKKVGELARNLCRRVVTNEDPSGAEWRELEAAAAEAKYESIADASACVMLVAGLAASRDPEATASMAYQASIGALRSESDRGGSFAGSFEEFEEAPRRNQRRYWRQMVSYFPIAIESQQASDAKREAQESRQK